MLENDQSKAIEVFVYDFLNLQQTGSVFDCTDRKTEYMLWVFNDLSRTSRCTYWYCVFLVDLIMRKLKIVCVMQMIWCTVCWSHLTGTDPAQLLSYQCQTTKAKELWPANIAMGGVLWAAETIFSWTVPAQTFSVRINFLPGNPTACWFLINLILDRREKSSLHLQVCKVFGLF